MTEHMSKKILVVGATGTVGSSLVQALVAAGEQVKAATRDPSRAMGEHVEAVLYDFDDPETFDEALKDVDRVFYLSRPADPTAHEVAGPLFEKAAAAGIKHIVNMSLMAARVDDDLALRKVELLLQSSGVPYTLLRPNWFMQNFSTGNFGPMIREQSGLFLPAADALVSFIDSRDIAAVAAKILTEGGHAGATYTLTGPQAFTHSQVAEVLGAAAGRTITYLPISDADLRGSLAGLGTPGFVIDFMLFLFGAVRGGANAPVSVDVLSVLGREPRSLAAFVEEFAGSLSA